MPIKRSSYKDLKKSRKRHTRNTSIKHELKTAEKNFNKLIAEKKANEAKTALAGLVSKLGKAASKGIIKQNTASRKIARIMKRLSSLANA
ncbi:MAG: 30S ribosomal protein S20 [Candidatus Omnitrophota bacterium]|nr:30S ribosomal protein S20 [Candidatus Omnitrophota bacterium]